MKRKRPMYAQDENKCEGHYFFGHTKEELIETKYYETRPHKSTIEIQIFCVFTSSVCSYCPAKKDTITFHVSINGYRYFHQTLDDAREHVRKFIEE